MKAYQATFWLAITMAAFLLSAAPAGAQQAASEAKPAAKKAPAKARGRLPVYYNQVVTPDQREKIYSIQASYQQRLEALQAQLKELQDQMNGEIKAILTAEQIKKVEELTAATQEKIKAARAADSKGTGKAVPTEPVKAAATPAKK